VILGENWSEREFFFGSFFSRKEQFIVFVLLYGLIYSKIAIQDRYIFALVLWFAF